MGANTKIEWAHHTFNPWQGCSKVSPGCANCYAEERNRRFHTVEWGPGGTRKRTADSNWKLPLQWNKAAAAAGERHRVFCASLADVFEDFPTLDTYRIDLFELIAMTPNLDWLLLTKRPENAHAMMLAAISELGGENREWPWANIWIGTSVENQEQADKRIPELLKIPAKVRFLSMEPLLGPVTFKPLVSIEQTVEFAVMGKLNQLYEPAMLYGIHWVIVGGESGRDARPMHPSWAKSLRDQCRAAGVAFHFKQWGEWGGVGPPRPVQFPAVCTLRRDGSTFTPDLNNPICPGDVARARVGKHAAGRILDGRTWDEVPEVQL